MNANDRFFARDAKVDSAAVAPLPASRKIHVQGSRPDVRVPMREISQSDTPASFGAEENPPLAVYDTLRSVHRPERSHRHPQRTRLRCAPHGSPSATTRSSSLVRRRRTARRALPIPSLPAFASTSLASRCVPGRAPT